MEGDAVVTMPSTSGRARAWVGVLAGVGLLVAVGPRTAHAQVKTAAGLVEGVTADEGRIRVFKGVPFAASPVGALRWKAPAPVPAWTGVRKADSFGAQCLQPPVFDDIVFDRPASEDCLYLNLWTPAKDAAARLPVMVWIHGGGYQAGASHEPRHDGVRLARNGVVLITVNYRMGVVGFFAHPALSKDDARGSSGNYGLLDMVAALQWVRDNVAAFGGDPGNVTIFGESAGSFAVDAMMVMPQARGLFHKVIGESGAHFGPSLAASTREASETNGEKFGAALGATTAEALRARPATEVLAAAAKWQPWFAPAIDGRVLRRADPQALRSRRRRVAEGLSRHDRRRRDRVGRGHAGDLLIGYSTWKWIEAHRATGHAPVYRYLFSRKIPVPAGQVRNGRPVTAEDIGARHAGEIEYVFGTLDSVKGVAWTPADRALSDAIGKHWTNFARSGNPNGDGLQAWPVLGPLPGPGARQDMGPRLIEFDTTIQAIPEPNRARYEVLDGILGAPRP